MNLQEIHQIYNQTNKDMSRQEFVKEFQRLINPAEVQKDLGKIMARKRIEARERQEIDRAVKNAR